MAKYAIICTFFALFLLNPVFAEEGMLFYSPGSNSYHTGEIFSVKLMVDTGDYYINAVETSFSFPADKLEVLNISKKDSVLFLWPEEPDFSNEKGVVSLAGGLPNPGFKGSGNIITVEFIAKNEGEATFYFGKSRLLANDGQGTNILSFLKHSKYFIYESKNILGEYKGSGAPYIFSPTHPEQDQWYNNTNIIFKWSLDESVKSVSYVFDKNPNTIPDSVAEDFIMEKTYENTPDGIWYFHLKFYNGYEWTDTRHYGVQVDASPPEKFDIIIDNKGDPTNPNLSLFFEAQDHVSGVEQYRVRIDDGDFIDLMLAQMNPFIVNLDPGTHKITARATDKAYNTVRTTALLSVDPIDAPVINIFSDNYASGQENFYIEGLSIPKTKVSIFLEGENGKIKNWETYAAEDGLWFFSTKEMLKPGFYYLYAAAEDDRGAKSDFSEKNKITVTFDGFIAGPFMITLKSLVLVFAAVFLIAFLLLLRGFVKNERDKKLLKKETTEAKESLYNNFSSLEKEIERKIGLFDSKPGFNDDERKVYESIKESLGKTKESINKEIEDIEKGLK